MFLATHGIIQSMQAAAAANLLLDDYPAAAAYSLRKLRAAYSGSAIRVRRSSDDAEQDIGFSGTALDTSALSSFVGANSGYVVTWYDQIGSDHVTNSTPAQQPRIVNAGTTETQNSLPSVYFDGTNDRLVKATSAVAQNIGYLTPIAVVRYEVSNAGQVKMCAYSKNGSTAIRAFMGVGNTADKYAAGGSRLDADGLQNVSGSLGVNEAALVLQRALFEYAISDLGIFLNGTVDTGTGSFHTAGNTENASSDLFIIGMNPDQVIHPFQGWLSELIVYNTNQSSNLSSIESEINTAYTIY